MNAADRWALIEESMEPMTVSEQVAPIVRGMRYYMAPDAFGPYTIDPRDLATGIEAMAFEIDRLRARLRLVGIALTLLAIAAAGVMLRA